MLRMLEFLDQSFFKKIFKANQINVLNIFLFEREKESKISLPNLPAQSPCPGSKAIRGGGHPWHLLKNPGLRRRGTDVGVALSGDCPLEEGFALSFVTV